MKRVLAVFFPFAACQVAPTSTRINLEATEGIPDWLAPKFTVGERSATSPVFEDQRSFLQSTRAIVPLMPIAREPVTANQNHAIGNLDGQGFSPWPPIPVFVRILDRSGPAYPGYRTPEAILTNGVSSRLSIARWQGSEAPMNQLFDLKVDATRGVTFLGRTCVPPSEFGRWHRFNMRIRWANDDTGFLEVRCDVSLHTGKPIFAQSEFPTNQALHCFRANNCEPGSFQRPAAVRYATRHSF